MVVVAAALVQGSAVRRPQGAAVLRALRYVAFEPRVGHGLRNPPEPVDLRAVSPRGRCTGRDASPIVEQTIAQTKGVPGATGGEPLATFPTLNELSGRDLVGLRYRQLADAVDVDAQKAFVVVAGEFVTNDEGTGLVHMAPAFGADDYDTVRREGLAFVNPVGEDGRFIGTAWDAINGLTVFESNDVIAARLVEENKVFGRYEPKGYEHTYPFCWRCDSPLLYYARRSWFVRTTAFRERMIECNDGVKWSPPEVGSGRFGEWLENNVDWALSRDRYWGTPLPAWVCDAHREHTVVIGSFAELAEASGKALPDDFDPHKPFIDAIVFKCRDCGGTMQRVPAVIDAWFDSGAMPFAQWHYPFENRDEFQSHFPADFICEGLDQTRGWFYSLLAIAAGVCDRPAYLNVIVNGLVLDPEGRKMSKRIGNVVDPWEAVREFGADAVRLYLLVSSQVWLPKRFDSRAIPEVALGFLNRLRNTFNFLAQYAEDWTPGDDPPVAERALVDRWLLTALDGVVEKVHAAWAGYDVRGGTKAVMDFCDTDLSNWYVRVNRGRFWAPDSSADPAALATLYETLVAVTRLLAPAAPFLSDAIHRRLTGASVHLARMPVAAAERDAALDVAMDAVRKLVSLARFARDDAGLKVRQPLSEMRVAVPAAVRGERFDEFMGLLASEVNVGVVNVVESDGELVELRGKANFRTLGKVYGAETPAAAKAASDLTSQQLRDLEAGETVSLQANDRSFTYRPEDVVVERDVKTDWLVRSDGPYVVALDPRLTVELRQEGIARELVNRVQRLRKEAGYEYTTRIAMSVSGAQGVLNALRSFETYVAGETLARRVDVGADLPDADQRETTEIDGAEVVVSLKRD